MEKYRVINLETENEEVHEYNIFVQMNGNNHREIILTRSLDDTWSDHAKGQEVIKIIDTGDGYVLPKKEFAGDVGYDKFAELYILMQFISKTEHLPTYIGRIEKVNDEVFNI